MPIVIESAESPAGYRIEVCYENGKKVLNSENANYSFGALKRVFELALQRSPFDFTKAKDVLILGFGAGSIVDILRKKYDYTGNITGLEKDAVVLQLAKKYFPASFGEVDIIQNDAIQYISRVKNPFDVIFVDLFDDNQVIAGAQSREFVEHLFKATSSKGKVYQNLMLGAPEDLNNIVEYYQAFFTKVDVLNFLGSNQVIVAQK